MKMKKFLLAAAAIVITIASAQAGALSDLRKEEMEKKNAPEKEYAYECAITKATHSDDPSYKIAIVVSDTGFLRVVHTTASGKTYNRVDQYSDAKTGPERKDEDWSTSPLIWIGTYDKSHDLSMVGKIGSNKGKLFYFETLYKKVKGKQAPAASLESACHRVQA
jgi:hypothetical protein